MNDKIISLLVGLLIALGGWSLSRTFELSTIQAVHEDKVQKLEKRVEKLQDKMDKMMDSDEEIMEQHKKLFEKLDKGSTGYSYN
jgi:peptidoglycan hydrolase CwlO-like protein